MIHTIVQVCRDHPEIVIFPAIAAGYLLGALTGAETSKPAINALVEDAECDAPILGFTVPYAIGNVLPTVWGTVVVNLM